ncbi:MAG TPA: DUF3825 domain-containing protein [Streptosporangiaceae bacterium]|nr:DUF3825 domain-containing protein [Streptosporangiaceae bacterium]
MTLHESKHAGYNDLGRHHQHFIGENGAGGAHAAPSPQSPQSQQGAPAIATSRAPEFPPAPAGGGASTMSPLTPPGAAPPSVPPQPAPLPQQGAPQQAAPQRAALPRRAQRAQRVQRAIYKHADLGRLRGDAEPAHADDAFDQLARIAEPENWSGPAQAEHDETWVLREYVEWTFERLYQQRHIVNSPDGGYSVFNTGLATAQQETIYGLFVPNRDPDGPPWQLKGWLPESDRQLHDHFPALPGFASYTEDPGDFVYDWRRELVVSPKHLLDSQENLGSLPDPLRSNPYQASLVMEGAVRRAEARVRRSYRAAVPCWDPARERLQLLLPLSLTAPENVDVALVTSHEGDTYHGHTVLGLDVAYARARLIARPEEWLSAK